MGFSPIVAVTSIEQRDVAPRTFNCAQIVMVRAGSVILFGEFGRRYLNPGDAVLIPSFTLFGLEPEPWVTTTTVYIDRDFLIDQIFWQYAAVFADRFDTQQFLDSQAIDPARVIHLGEAKAGLLMPWLDELTILSTDGALPDRFYRLQALLFSIFDVVVPTLDLVEENQSRTRVQPRTLRHRTFAPIQDEARIADSVLRDGLSEQWTLDQLAEVVHLSPSRVGRLFREAFGKSPIAYLTMLRIERMADLLRTTDESIGTIANQVGWPDPDYAGRLFRRNIGYSPRQYRTLSRRVPLAGQPGG